MKQEHVVLIGEPEGKYIGHVTPSGKAAEPTAAKMINFLKEKILINSWMLVGADSTALNTGRDNDIIARCERHIWASLALGHMLAAHQ